MAKSELNLIRKTWLTGKAEGRTGSFAVTVPKLVAQYLKLEEGDSIIFTRVGDKVVIDKGITPSRLDKVLTRTGLTKKELQKLLEEE